MTIDSLTIAAFGGLKNKTLSLHEGLNVIYGDNENGKTTVMSFLKMMFYGSERSSSQVAKNIRKKYTPWDGSSMAGSVDFTHNGRKYRLEREFKSSNSTDKVFLCDLDLGTREAVSGDVGLRFFGLSAAAFERSVFIGAPGGSEKDSSAESELGAKLSNLVTTGEETVSYNTVYSRLEKARLALKSKSGRTGQYDKNVRRLAELNEELAKTEQTLTDYREHQAAAKAAAAKIEQMTGQAADLKEKIDREQDVRNAEKLREMLDCKQELDGLNQALALTDGSLMDELYVKKLDFCLRKVEATAQKISEKTDEAENLRRSIQLAEHPDEEITPAHAAELRAKADRLETERTQFHAAAEDAQKEQDALTDTLATRRKTSCLFLGIAAIVLAVAAVLLALFEQIIAVGICGGAAVACSLAAVILFRHKKQEIARLERSIDGQKTLCAEQKAKESETVQALSEVRVHLAAVEAALGSSAAVIAGQKTLLADCEKAVDTLQTRLKAEQQDLFTLFGRYRAAQTVEEVKAALPLLTEQADKQKEYKQRLRYLARDVGDLSYDEARKKLATLSTEQTQTADFEVLKAEYAALLQDITEKKTALAAADADAKATLRHVKEPGALQEEITALREKIAEQEHFCQAAELAMQVLDDSFARLRRGYGAALDKKAGAIFAGLTGNRYSGMQISKAFDIHVERPDVFGGKESAYLSSGTEDQAYLSLRLALSELIFENGETLPLFLDDVLCRYDDTRAEAAVAFLKQYSEKGQTVLFTCHRTVSDAAARLGAANGTLNQ